MFSSHLRDVMRVHILPRLPIRALVYLAGVCRGARALAEQSGRLEMWREYARTHTSLGLAYCAIVHGETELFCHTYEPKVADLNYPAWTWATLRHRRDDIFHLMLSNSEFKFALGRIALVHGREDLFNRARSASLAISFRWNNSDVYKCALAGNCTNMVREIEAKISRWNSAFSNDRILTSKAIAAAFNGDIDAALSNYEPGGIFEEDVALVALESGHVSITLECLKTWRLSDHMNTSLYAYSWLHLEGEAIRDFYKTHDIHVRSYHVYITITTMIQHGKIDQLYTLPILEHSIDIYEVEDVADFKQQAIRAIISTGNIQLLVWALDKWLFTIENVEGEKLNNGSNLRAIVELYREFGGKCFMAHVIWWD